MNDDARKAECPCGADIVSIGGGAWFTAGSWPPQFNCYPVADGPDGEAQHEPLEA